ncbi:MAG: transposase family protein [Proteobacteria bacterium]|nr:transposase family protein [Pseudomonadota bacterium]
MAGLLEHVAEIEDPCDICRILHPLPEILLLVVCGTMAGCDDYDHVAVWAEAHLDFLRRYAPSSIASPVAAG